MYRPIITNFLIDIFFGHEDGGDIFLQNIGELLNYAALKSKPSYSS
jgi:hypothetical protein